MANTTWVNDDGLVVRYGNTQGKRGVGAGVTRSNSKEVELVLTAELAGPARTLFSTDLDNDGTADGFSARDGVIPQGVKIIGQDVIIIEAPAGGTNYTVGTFLEDGTVVDADGIRTTTGTDGVQVNTQSTAPWAATVTTTGVYTAGIIKVVIRYLTV